ncbi:MAG: gliding motility-associated C-terminal domain-containing protein [Crocinitomicaceae bacterium]|nr:gliding motility-associated C-terminal domain-containing protein [Crocinitomicaceae bacterium]
MIYIKKAIILLLLALANQFAIGQTVVTNINDSGVGSLRAAVNGASPGEVITFDPSLAGQTITLTSGELLLVNSITVNGENNNITISGGGLSRIFHVNGNSYTLFLKNITLTNGQSNNGGAVFSENGATVEADRVRFIDNNSGGDGGAVRVQGGTHAFRNCEFVGNSCSFFGGGYSSLFASASFENVLFSGNLAGSGGALYLRGSTTLVGCTVSGNKANDFGGAMFVYSGTVVNVDNSIFWKNEKSGTIGTIASFYEVENGSLIDLTARRCIIEGSGGSGSWVLAFGTDGGGNLDADPNFALQVSPSSAPTTSGNYRPQVFSPAHDNGGNSFATLGTDLDGHGRIMYGVIDRGAYEYCTTYSSMTQSACSEFNSPAGNVYTATGVYYDTLVNALGCDSVITINLTILNTYNSIAETHCDNMVSPSGLYTWTTSGTYNDTIPNAVGCDSIITVNLTILYSTTSTVVETACNSYTVPSGSATYTSSGVYTDTLTNSVGCDSIIVIDLTILNSSASTISQTVCDSYTVPSGDETYTVSGVYTDTIPNVAGCDSVISISLTVNYNNFSSVPFTVCDSMVSPSGLYTWSTSGTYNDTIPNSAGCDSVIIATVTVLNSTSSSVTETACNSYTVPSGDETYFASGTYTDTIPNTAGCDSLITINLTVNYSNSSSISLSNCDSIVSPSGLYTWYTSGTYIDTVTNVAGCDSVITIQATVNDATSGNITDAVCYSYTSPSGNYIYTSTGVYYDTIPNTAGCDSIITIDLTVYNTTFGNLSVFDCASYTSPSGNHIWTSSGTYYDTIPNMYGCDSIITIDLTIPMPQSTIDTTVCDSYVSPSGQYEWTTSGAYTDVVTSFQGCDSIITINLIVNSADNYISVSGTELSTGVFADNYNWVYCDSTTVLSTDEYFNPQFSGDYAVIVMNDNCIDTSDCVYVEVPIEKITAFSPNGDGINDVLKLDIRDFENTVIIYNRWGDIVAQFINYNDMDVVWDGTQSTTGQKISGTYFYIIENTTGSRTGWVQLVE